MNDTDNISELKIENAKLKEDKAKLLDTVAQMNLIINRLVIRYISAEKENR